MLNETLTWSDHVNMVCGKVTRSLNLLRRLSSFLPRSLLLLYLKSYILPSFDYCDVVWSNCTQEESRRLETLLNFGCKVVLHRYRDYSSTAARKELDLTTLSLRRQLRYVLNVTNIFPLKSSEVIIGILRVNLMEVCGNYLRGKWLHTKVFSEIVSKHIRLLKYEDRSRKQKR